MAEILILRKIFLVNLQNSENRYPIRTITSGNLKTVITVIICFNEKIIIFLLLLHGQKISSILPIPFVVAILWTAQSVTLLRIATNSLIVKSAITAINACSVKIVQSVMLLLIFQVVTTVSFVQT